MKTPGEKVKNIEPFTSPSVNTRSPFYRETAPQGWKILAGQVEITGELARLIYEGGSPSWKRTTCKCSPRTDHSVSEGGKYNLWAKGQSCVHTASSLVYGLVRAGAQYGEILSLVSNPDNRGFAWLQHCESREDEPDRWWNNALPFVLMSMYERTHSWRKKMSTVFPKVRLPKASTAKDGFKFYTACWQKFLQMVGKSPDSAQREVENTMNYRYGWRRGVTDRYRKEAVRRGYIKAVSAGFRNRKHLVLLDWPPISERPVLEHRVDLVTGEVFVSRTKRLTPSQARYAIFRGVDVAQAQADLAHWQAVAESEAVEASARRHRARQRSAAEMKVGSYA